MRRITTILSLALLGACGGGGGGSSGGTGSSSGTSGGGAPAIPAPAPGTATYANPIAIPGLTPLDVADAGGSHFYILGLDRLAKVDARTGQADLSFAPPTAAAPAAVYPYAGDGSMVFDTSYAYPVAIAYDDVRDRLYVLTKNKSHTLVYAFRGDGTSDAAFGANGVASYAGSGSIKWSFSISAAAMGVDPATGRILVAGVGYEYQAFKSSWYGIGLLCFDTQGALDPAFANDNRAITPAGVGFYLADPAGKFQVFDVTATTMGEIWITGADYTTSKHAALLVAVHDDGSPRPILASNVNVPTAGGAMIYVYPHGDAARIWVGLNGQTRLPIGRSIVERQGEILVGLQPESGSGFAALLRIDAASGAMSAGLVDDPAWMASFGADLAIEGSHVLVAFTIIDPNGVSAPAVAILDGATLDRTSFGVSLRAAGGLNPRIFRTQPGELEMVHQDPGMAECTVEGLALP